MMGLTTGRGMIASSSTSSAVHRRILIGFIGGPSHPHRMVHRILIGWSIASSSDGPSHPHRMVHRILIGWSIASSSDGRYHRENLKPRPDGGLTRRRGVLYLGVEAKTLNVHYVGG